MWIVGTERSINFFDSAKYHHQDGEEGGGYCRMGGGNNGGSLAITGRGGYRCGGYIPPPSSTLRKFLKISLPINGCTAYKYIK